MKKCNRCNTEKDSSLFYRTKSYIYPYCKQCAKKAYAEKHYNDNKELYKKRSLLSQQKFKEKFKAFKSALKCTNCSEERYWCLDFHHVDPTIKNYTISYLSRNNSKKLLEEELKKCVVLCKNCHADYHYKLARGERIELSQQDLESRSPSLGTLPRL